VGWDGNWTSSESGAREEGRGEVMMQILIVYRANGT
jgi:hypothetical protein